MIGAALFALLIVAAPCICCADSAGRVLFRNEKHQHMPISLSNDQVRKVSHLSNVTHMNEVLDNICVVRVVGTPEHTRVKEYIIKSMRDLDWTVETDSFREQTPVFGRLKFENIVARWNPNAKRYLVLGCHYDSKYVREKNFVGATDSAVPCAQMLNLATVMKDQLNSIKHKNVSLMFIFFDGEEAFKQWGPKDSIYGAKHLARTWHTNYTNYEGQIISQIDKMDILVLLDLIGAPDPTFYNYFKNTEKWYAVLMAMEEKLVNMRLLNSYSYDKPAQRYFQPYSISANIEDDHTPFLQRDVPILHVIPYPFPTVWHKPSDNRSIVDLTTTENINKILRSFVATYLHINI